MIPESNAAMTEYDDPISDRVENAPDLRDERLADCPVTPMGHRSGKYYFLSPVGELRVLSPSDFTATGLASLFEGDTKWLWDHFPRKDKEGNVIGISTSVAGAFLISACAAEGLFDTTMAVRGIGVWRGGIGDDGNPQLVVHCGDQILHEGQWIRSGCKIGHAIYPAAPPVAAFSAKEATPEDGKELLGLLKRWNWTDPERDAGLLLGEIGQAFYGGASSWRSHMIINGLAGSGKSSLVSLVSGVMGAGAHPQTNNFTEAGLRQALSGEARCLILDEAEAEEGQNRVQSVIELLRHMSGGEGVRAVRGSTGGNALSYTVTGSALLFSILRVPLKPQDRSRITALSIHPLQASPDAVSIVTAGIAAMSKKSKLFRARMINRWPQFLETFDLYRADFISAGLSGRGADQLATILAGRDTLLHDTPPDTDSRLAEIDLVKYMVQEEKATRAENEGTQCLNHLYSAPVDSYRGGDRLTLGQMIQEAIEAPSVEDMRKDNKKLGVHGVKLQICDQYKIVKGVLIANSHQGLTRIFAGTRWANGGWVGALEYLQCAVCKPERFAGAVSRALSLPADQWPNADLSEAPE